MMKAPRRSGCPISFSLDIIGDRWSLLILRDIAFKSARYFQDFFEADEGISSNILAERLRRLETCGIVKKAPDPEDGRRYRYTLAPAGLELIPLLIDLTIWGGRHDPDSSFPQARIERMARDREGAIRYYRERAV